MALKLENNLSHSNIQDRTVTVDDKTSVSKVEALYLALICFTTHCLSSIAFEAGGRTPLGNTMTKSAAFNALFRRSFNLKIVVLVTNVIVGLITTVMMTLGDKYGIPYLYIPWLVNTMRGLALCEGPAIFNLITALLPNITIPAGTFIFMTFLLFVEELCIWNNAFANFQRCWRNYNYRKQCATTRIKEKLYATRKTKLICQGTVDNELNVALEKLQTEQRPDQPLYRSNSRISVKSNAEGNSNFVKDELADVTG